MNCQECHNYIDAYIDNELDVAATIMVQQHLGDCLECQQLLQARKELGVLLGNPEVRFAVPDQLFNRIQSVLPVPGPSVKQPPSGRRIVIPWFSVPLAMAATIAVFLGLAFWNRGGIFDHSGTQPLAREVISSHVRSLLGTHLLDVPSTDQHTVKPWFNGKLQFSPPVHDLAQHNFPLIGGRLDYFNGQEVAALVYHHDKHIINLFVWPVESASDRAPESFTQDGYNVSHWVHDGFEFWAVSDLNREELKAFSGLEIQPS
jgi:anti-sigma factor RsiW